MTKSDLIAVYRQAALTILRDTMNDVELKPVLNDRYCENAFLVVFNSIYEVIHECPVAKLHIIKPEIGAGEIDYSEILAISRSDALLFALESVEIMCSDNNFLCAASIQDWWSNILDNYDVGDSVSLNGGITHITALELSKMGLNELEPLISGGHVSKEEPSYEPN